jgi:hypothetical protein
MRIENVNDLGKIGEGTGETINLINNDRFNFAGHDVIEKSFEGRAFDRAPRKTAIVVPFRSCDPALVFLAST